MRIVTILYQDNNCNIAMNNAIFVGFGITRGIRQGCPLSPLLFAVASELLLRRLRKLVGEATSRAWADDIAMIVPSGLSALPLMASIVHEFPLASGLWLGIGKCVLVPLFPVDFLALRADLAQWVPQWATMAIADAAKYLGVFGGPGKQLSLIHI